MVAVVSGNGLGLFNASSNTLHGSGQSRLGQAAGESYVNASNGNLVLRFLDEQLSGAGLDVTALRTYNSLGNATDGDGDNWRWGGERKVSLTTGTANTPGSSVSRTTGDGYSAVYNWNAASNRYESSEGDGAADFITWNASTREWTWVDGSALVADTYDESGRLTSQRDRHGNALNYAYNNGLLASIEDLGSKQKIVFNYAPTESNPSLTRLQSVATYSLVVDSTTGLPTGLGPVVSQVTYGYDNLGRLTSVTADLTSGIDNIVADGQLYTTSYTYEGESLRITSVTQSDGTRASFSYYSNGKVQSVTDSQGTQVFTYNENKTTSITNGVGQVWVYHYDIEGKLTKTQTPAVNGQIISTSYAYDARGNLTEKIDGRGFKVVYQYDSKDNCIYERDAIGNTITRTYDSNNQLLTETRYLKADPDGAGSQAATEPVTQRYAYDAQNRLRFFVSAQGRVTEYRYTNLANGSNTVNGVLDKTIDYTNAMYNLTGLSNTASLTESQLASWAKSQIKSLVHLTQNTYDWRGNLKNITEYDRVDTAGNGVFSNGMTVTDYIYSEHGQLLKAIVKRGDTRTSGTVINSITYDGMGRQLSVMNQGVTQTYVYDGVNRAISVTNAASGLTTVSAYNNLGQMIAVTQNAVSETSRQSRQIYDQAGRLVMTENPTGSREYYFYDVLGRVQYTVDALGAVTENQYNQNNQLLNQIQFNKLVNTTAWFNGEAVIKTTLTKGASGTDIITDSGNDRVVVEYQYDAAGRVTRENKLGTIRYFTYDGVSNVIKHNISDRTTRNFYDNDGKLIGSLDGEGFLSENTYDAAGRLIQRKKYSVPTAAELRVSGTLAALKTGLTSSTDLNSYFYYDSQGRVVGSVDEKGVFTETIYVDGFSYQQVKTYQIPVLVSTGDDINSIRSRAGNAYTHVTMFDSFNRIYKEVATDGTYTDYEYDSAGRVARTVVGKNQSEIDAVTGSQRGIRNRYNAFGELTGQVSGIGEFALGDNPTTSSINQAIATYGEQRIYDTAGRLIQTIDANNHKTAYYYDNNNQIRFTANAAGEVKEYRYNAFGQATSTRTFADRLTDLSDLDGGATTEAIATRFNALSNAGQDRVTVSNYNNRGLLTSQTDAEGFVSSFAYNGFGEISTQTNTIANGVTTSSLYQYNKRGELLSTTHDNGGLAAKTENTYDAFGRLKSTKNANGKTTSYQYDNSGRTITITDPLGFTHKSDYDVLGRALNRTDSAGNITTYLYDDANRSVKVTTPEGTSVTTYNNRHGQTLKVVDAKGNETKYTYDKNGNVTQVTDALNQVVASNLYDNSGRLFESRDANGVATQLTYDAVNRVITRSVDPDGLNLQTKYQFNTSNQTIETIEAVGTAQAKVTQYTFDRKGQLKSVIADPNGLALRTDYSYDGVGNQVFVSRGSVSNPGQTLTLYVFDKLGRRISEVEAFDTLNLITHYKYDKNGNVTRRIDANGNSTWYVYDANNRQTHAINQLGEVSETQYDQAGNVKNTIQYAARISAATISTWVNVDVVSSVTPVATAGADNITEHLYDKNGRLTKTIVDPSDLAITTEYRFDANNNLTRKIDANGNSTWYVYNQLNQQTHSISALGKVTETRYDAAGQVIKTIHYGTAIPVGTVNTFGNIVSSITPVVNNSTDQTTTYQYDNDGRLTQKTVDPSGLVLTTKYHYDARDNLTRTIDADNNSTWYVYDTANRNAHTINAMGEITATQYNALGQAIQTTQYATRLTSTEINALGNVVNSLTPVTSSQDYVTNYEYDAQGRLVKTIVDPANFALTTEYRYDANGNRTRTIDAQGNSDWYIYDAANRQTHSVNAVGNIKETQYTADGKVSRTIEYATALNATQLFDLDDVNTQLPVTVTSDDSVTEYTYDADGRLLQKVVDPSGLLLTTQYRYDANDNLTRTIDANGNSTWYVYDKANRQVQTINALGGVIGTRYDVNGRVVKTTRYVVPITSAVMAGWEGLDRIDLVSVVGAGMDQVNYFAYDKADRLRFSVDSLGGVTETSYTPTGKVATTRKVGVALTATYMNGLNSSVNNGGNTEAFLSTATAASTQTTTSYTYDSLGRLTTSVLDSSTSGLNITTQYKYDTLGRLSRTIDANDNSTWNIYNSAGSLFQTIDGTGAVTRYGYKNGQLIYTYKHYATIDTTVLGDVVTSITTYNRNEDQMTLYTYDKAGRLQYETSRVDYNNHITKENRYDAKGNLVETIAYDKYLYRANTQAPLADNILTSDEVNAQLAILGYSTTNYGNARVTRYAYDANDRLRFTIDAAGYVSENTYDDKGNILTQTNYAVAINASSYTEDVVDSLVNKTHISNQTTRFTYDDLGRLLSSTDALNYSEHNQYDTFGNKISFTNKRGHVWTYSYDKANRLTAEFSPLVDVATIDVSNVVSTQSRQLVTRIVYDLNGNVRSRTEGILRDTGGTEDASQARTTQYEYDKANRQIKTILPGWYDPVTRAVESSGGGERYQRTSEVTYDAMGNAVRNKIRTGANDFIYQTKVYDQMGRTIFELDALNQVTQYFYDAFGSQVLSHTYDSHIGDVKNIGTLYTKEQMVGLVSALPYRSIETYYDSLGRKVEVRQERVMSNYFTNVDATTNVQGNATALNRAPSVRYAYDALGNVIFTRTAITTTEYANQWSFYNNRNQKIQDVFDVKAGEGYVTTYEYDAHGNLIKQIEHASVVSIPGVPSYGPTAPITPQAHSDDRTTRFTYDQLNRQTEIKRNSSYYEKSTTEPYVLMTNADHLEQTTVYDEIGNITNQIDAVKNQTKTQYDALGRVVKIDMPTRTTANASKTGLNLDPFLGQVSATPTISFEYNAFGQQIRETRAAGGGRGLDSGDIELTKRYDMAGNVLAAKNLSGNYTNYSYDIAGRVTSEKQLVSATFTGWVEANYSYNIEKRYEYDLLGHQTATFDIYQESGVAKKSGRQQIYNRFGEVVTEKATWGTADGSSSSNSTDLVSYTYDDAGRLTYKNAVDGITRYFYDLAGRNTRVEQQGNNLNSDGTGVRVTEYAYDKLGRVLTQRAPQFSAVTTELGTTTTLVTPTVSQTFDRWANILTRTAPNGSLHTYTYNNNNQVISETLPEMLLAKDDGTNWTPIIVKETHFDAAGRAVEDVQKANGIVSRKRYNEYNEVGQLTAYVDGTNVRTEYAYDAFGNKIGTRNGVGTVTVDSFDASGNQLTRGVLRRALTDYSNPLGYYYSPIGDVIGSNVNPHELVRQRYVYDHANRRVAEYDALSYAQYYAYDERGNLTKARNQLGIVTKSSVYNYQNLKIRETNVSLYQSWNYNNYGQLISEVGQGGIITNYTYNDFGQLATTDFDPNFSRITKAKTFSYKENGLLANSTENRAMYTMGNGILPIVHWEIKNIYEYNIDGNKVLDKTIQTNKDTELNNPQWGMFKDVYSHDLRSNYNKNGQLTKVLSPPGKLAYFSEDFYGTDSTFKSYEALGIVLQTNELPVLEYQYDEFGNRIEGDNFIYDVEGRILKNGNKNRGATAENNSNYNKTKMYSYDKAGRLEYTEELDGEYFSQDGSLVAMDTMVDRYSYNDDNQVAQIDSAYVFRDQNYRFDILTNSDINADVHFNEFDQRFYDDRGYLYLHRIGALYPYNITSVQQYEYREDGSLKHKSGFSDANNYSYGINYSYDSMGNLISYQQTVYSVGQPSYVTTYTYKYGFIHNNYRKYKETVTSTAPNTTAGWTEYAYSSEGFLTKARGSDASIRYLANDMHGHVVLRVDGREQNAKKQTNFYVDGNQVASLGSFGSRYDFGVTGTTEETTNSPENYVISAGDTLRGIAQAVWGDSALWYIIADANGIQEDPSVSLADYAGLNIKIPNVSRAQQNNAGTFRPYNATENIGNTTPNVLYTPPPPLPAPSGGDQCSKAGKVIAIVVIIAVVAAITIGTAGTAALAMGAAAQGMSTFAAGIAVTTGAGASIGLGVGATILAAGIGGMAGNFAAQMMKMSFGMQENFSGRELLVSGITAGFAAGAGTALQGWSGASLLKTGIASFGKGAAGYIVNQYANAYMGVDKLAGVQSDLDWGDMLISALSSSITSVAGAQYGKGAKGGAAFFKNYFSNFAGGATSAIGEHIQSAHRNRTVLGYKNGKIDWLAVGADAFGNTLGNSIIESAIKNHTPDQEMIKKYQDKNLEKALDKFGVEYHKDENGKIVADDNHQTYEFIHGIVEKGGNARIIEEIFKESPKLKKAINNLNNYGKEESGGRYDDIATRLTQADYDSEYAPIEYKWAPYAPEKLLAEVIIKPGVNESMLGTVLNFGLDATEEIIKFHETNPFLAEFAYEGTKAILSGGFVKPVITKLIKLAAGTVANKIEDTMLSGIENTVSEWVGGWAGENSIEFDINSIHIDGDTIGKLTGGFTSLVLGAVIGKGIEGFVSKGNGILGLIKSAAKRNPATERITPSDLGFSTIEENPEMLKMWNNAMRDAAGAKRENGYMRYLKALERGETPDQKMLEEAFGAVNSRFVKTARKDGINVAEVHHWNYKKTDYPTQIVDSRHLVPTPSRQAHQNIHDKTSSTDDIWVGPVDPLHEIKVPDWSTQWTPR